MDKVLYASHPVRCIITGASECEKSCFLTNLIFNIINDFGKIYNYSPSLHQDLHQKFFKCFNNFIPINVIQSIPNEEDIDPVIEEIIIDENFEKSQTLLETFESKKN